MRENERVREWERESGRKRMRENERVRGIATFSTVVCSNVG